MFLNSKLIFISNAFCHRLTRNMGDGTEFDVPDFESMDTFVCAECVADIALVEVVNNNLESNRCNYCGNESQNKLQPYEILDSHLLLTWRR